MTRQKPPNWSVLILGPHTEQGAPCLCAVMWTSVCLSSVLYDTNFIIKAGINKKRSRIYKGRSRAVEQKGCILVSRTGWESLYMVQWVLKL